MKTLVAKLLEVEETVSAQKGAFSLFALFLREDAADKWDLVISAPWIEADKEAALKLVAAQVTECLGPPAVTSISRIILVEPTSPAVNAINQAFRVEHSMVEVRDSNFFGLAIRHAYIFASGRQDT